jgi:hypothetical protein
MEQYDNTFEAEEAPPSIKEIEKRLRKLGCTKEQVRRHIEHVTKSRNEPVSKTRGKNRPHMLDWPQSEVRLLSGPKAPKILSRYRLRSGKEIRLVNRLGVQGTLATGATVVML